MELDPGFVFKAYTVLETLKNTKTGGRGESGVTLLNGDRFQFGKMTRSWRRVVVMVEQQCKCTSCH